METDGALGAARLRSLRESACKPRRAGTRCSRSCKVRCTPTCAASALASWSSWTPKAMRSAGLSVGEPRELSLEMTETTAAAAAGEPPALCHGGGHAGRVARICRPRRRHDGLRDAVAQRPKRVPVHQRGQGDHQAGPVPGRSLAGRRNCGCYTCRTFSRAYLRHFVSAGEMLYSAPWRPSTTWGITLTSCGGCERLFVLGTFPEFLKAARAFRRGVRPDRLSKSP